MTILVVHDQTGARAVIEKYLRDQGGFEIIGANCGLEALEIVRSNSSSGKNVINTVLCRANIRESRGSGLELLRNLKDQQKLVKLRFILFEPQQFIMQSEWRVDLKEFVSAYKGQRVHFCIWEKEGDTSRFLNLLPSKKGQEFFSAKKRRGPGA